MAVVKAPINGDLLAWARDEHGLSVLHAARALGVTPERLALWEAGDAQPTLNQLRKAATLYERTPAFFLLRHTPGSDQHRRPTDFRSFAGETPTFGRALAREVARARARRRHLLQIQEASPNLLPHVPDLLKEPADAAKQVRQQLGLTVEKQSSLPICSVGPARCATSGTRAASRRAAMPSPLSC